MSCLFMLSIWAQRWYNFLWYSWSHRLHFKYLKSISLPLSSSLTVNSAHWCNSDNDILTLRTYSQTLFSVTVLDSIENADSIDLFESSTQVLIWSTAVNLLRADKEEQWVHWQLQYSELIWDREADETLRNRLYDT